MRLKEVSERKEKVEKIYFETEKKKSSKRKENIGVFLRKKISTKYRLFPEGRKSILLHNIYFRA